MVMKKPAADADTFITMLAPFKGQHPLSRRVDLQDEPLSKERSHNLGCGFITDNVGMNFSAQYSHMRRKRFCKNFPLRSFHIHHYECRLKICQNSTKSHHFHGDFFRSATIHQR